MSGEVLVAPVTALLVGSVVLALSAAVRSRREQAVAARLRPAVGGEQARATGGWAAPAQASGRPGARALQELLVPALIRSDLTVEAEVVARVWPLATVVVALLATVLGGPALGSVAAVGVVLGPVLVLWSTRDRRARRLDRELSLVLDAVAGSLRGGGSLAGAIEVAAAVPGPAGEAATSLVVAVRAGRPLADALDRWQTEVGGSAVRLVAAALALAAETGGTAARAVDGVAATLRERIEVGDEVHALGAQARLSAVVIAAAPIGFALVAGATDPRTVAFLLGTPVGLVCLVVGVTLDVSAYLWMRQIVGDHR